jgi:RimJ/RimL family protein N-acetyltransferase
MDAETLTGERPTLTPMVPGDAGEMAEVLADESLYEFTSGAPMDVAQLRARYERMAAGSGMGDERWLNWVVRRPSDDRPVGTVQATVMDREGARTAWVAWVTGVPWQGQGFATEAARLVVAWLGEHGVTRCSRPCGRGISHRSEWLRWPASHQPIVWSTASASGNSV